MARPWRIEFEGALYHVLSRGNEQKDIFRNNEDRVSFLNCMGEMSERFETDIFAYVLMGNHYHILLRTNRANLSRAMRWMRANITRARISKDSKFKKQFEQLKSQIKM